MSSSPTIEAADAAVDDILAAHYRAHWADQGVDEQGRNPDWLVEFHSFLAEARTYRQFAAFLARAEGRIVGSACCHQVDRVYPPFLAHDKGEVGYVWGVYVDPAARGRGLGSELVRACIEHLKFSGCHRVLLHSGSRARPVYERLGFEPTDELSIRLQSSEAI